MVIIWGIPSDLTLGTSATATSWDDCISQCSSDPNCVFASTQSSNCLLFEFGTNLTITDAPYGSPNKVAFKTINSTSTCPLTPDNSTFYGDVTNSSAPLTLRTYSIVNDNGQWLLVSTVTKTCPANWQKFTRSLGEWCLLVSYAGATLSYSDAQSTCSGVSAVFSGPDSMEEYDYLLAYATSVNFPSNSVYVWVDGTRTTACSFTSNYTTCSAAQAFSFVDPTLSAYNSSFWATKQPSGNSGANRGFLQSVITMMFSADANFGLLDDI